MALASGRPGLVAWLFGTGAVLAFLVHEPLLVLLGHRGTRARREDGPRAARVGVALAGSAAVLGSLAMIGASPEARQAAILPVGLTLLALGLVWRKQERSLLGEIVAASALSGAGVPIAVSGGTTVNNAIGMWWSWALGFAAVTFAVRAVVARDQRRGRWLGPLAIAGILGLGSGQGWLSVSSVLSAIPLLLAALLITALKPAPTGLRKVGWVLVVASLVTGGLLLLLPGGVR